MKNIRFKSKAGLTSILFDLIIYSNLAAHLEEYYPNYHITRLNIDNKIDTILKQNMDLIYHRLSSKYGK